MYDIARRAIDYLYALLSPAVEQNHYAVSVRGQRHRQWHRTKRVTGSGRVEKRARRQPLLPDGILTRDVGADARRRRTTRERGEQSQ